MGGAYKTILRVTRSVGTLFASNATTAVPDSTNRQYLSKSLWDGSCQELCPRLNSALHGFSYLVLSWSLTSKDPIRLVDFFSVKVIDVKNCFRDIWSFKLKFNWKVFTLIIYISIIVFKIQTWYRLQFFFKTETIILSIKSVCLNLCLEFKIIQDWEIFSQRFRIR